ncbi:MAG TPA: hypothetical protein VF137_04415 [Candidatus Dormibacteraeota bacterium]
MSKARWSASALAALLAAGGIAVATVPAEAAMGTGPCAHVAAAEPQSGHNMPPPAPGYMSDPANPPAYPHFAADFPVIHDCEWGYPIGGFGGLHRHAPLKHVPIVFVHGNQADAENWFLVRDQLLQQGWTDQEMYGISYNGLANWYAGAPLQSQPDASTQAYLAANPQALANGGNGAANDVNVPDVYAFVRAVMDYTGSPYVDIVAHSLGVTIVRKMMYEHRDLYQHVLAGVMIAGGNHGTSVCYELQTSYYGCDEIAPDDSLTGYVNPWLQQLNSIGEAPGPTCWQTIYDGTGGDPFFDPPYTQSPAQQGADNHGEFAGFYHNDLRVSPTTVAVYSKFLLDRGQLESARCGVAAQALAARSAPAERLLAAEGATSSGESSEESQSGSAGAPAVAPKPAAAAPGSTAPSPAAPVLRHRPAAAAPVAARPAALVIGLIVLGLALLAAAAVAVTRRTAPA